MASQFVSRRNLDQAMKIIVDRAVTDDRSVEVDSEAARLLAQIPDTGLTRGDVRNALSRLAVSEQVTVIFDEAAK